MKNKNTNQEPMWFSADGWNGADGWDAADGWNNAEGGGERQAAAPRTSQPYIIQIVNACTSAIASVDLGDAYTSRTNTAPYFQNSTNISITSTITGVSYLEFLAQSESQPFKIGRTMVVSTSAGQLDQTIAVTHRNAVGDRQDHVITPTLDPYQQQTDRIIDDYEFLFDGFTRLRFNQINASATVTVRLYPMNKFTATQLVAGRPSQIDYSAPHLIKVGQVALKRG